MPMFETELEEGALEALEARLIQRIERKSDAGLTERMFERLRAQTAGCRDDVTQLEAKVEGLPSLEMVDDRIRKALSKINFERPEPLSIRPLKL
jgi:hypothetical protein